MAIEGKPVTRTYKYGLRPPHINAALVSTQISAAHRYYNKLIELERERRDRDAEATRSYAPTIEMLEAWVAAVEERLEAAVKDIRRTRARTRSRSDTSEQRQCATEARIQLREVRRLLRDERRALRDDVELKARTDEIKEEFEEYVRVARNSSTVFWGTYLVIEAAVDLAKKSPTPPAFRRWSGQGLVGMQLQKGGLDAREVQSGLDRRLQLISAPPPGANYPPGAPRPDPRSKRSKKRQHKILRLRVGSVGRDPIWAEWRAILHRPIPPTATIVWAKVVRERLAGKDRWSLHLTVKLPAPRPQVTDGVVAVDLGWRRHNGTLRVGYLVDHKGAEHDFKLDVNVLAELAKVDDLRSIRDKNFDAIRDWLVAWRAATPAQGEIPATSREDAPTCAAPASRTWWDDALQYLAQWKAPRRLAGLVARWRNERWPGDDEAFAQVDAWAQQDTHLWLWETNLRDQVLRRRREQYRVLGAKLARHYSTLVLEDFDLRVMQRHQLAEVKEGEIQPARSQQRLAAPSELRSCLVNAFASAGGLVVYVNPAYTTRICHACGSVEKWDAAAYLNHVCSMCGEGWDQDYNAAQNLLTRYNEWCEAGDVEAKGVKVVNHGQVEEKEAAWHKRKREKKENEDNASARATTPAT